MSNDANMRPIHPGEILIEEYLKAARSQAFPIPKRTVRER